MIRAARQALELARRELMGYLASPSAWVVLVLFLVVQGASFFAVVKVLADPRRPAPYGAVLRTHFGGTFLYWAFLFFVVAVITMRLVAEERRQGTWEALRAVAVPEGAIAAGKWLGALAFYTLLWLPTVAYVLLLAALAPPGAGPDPGPVLTAYAGVLLTGSAFLALGLAASSVTTNQLVAAVVTFVALVGVLLVGLLPEIAPEAFARRPTAAALAAAIDPRRIMDGFARGVVEARDVVALVAATLVALFAAALAMGADRRPRRFAPHAALALALAVAAALLVNVLAARHPAHLDVTRSGRYTLHERTLQILAEVRRPVRILVLSAGEPHFAELYDEVRHVLRRFAAASPHVTVAELDPALDPARLPALAAEHRLAPEELAGGGAVVFTSGERRRAVALLDMAAFGAGERGGVLRELRAEEEFARALLEVSDERRPELCFTTGHGELGRDPEETGEDLALVAAALARDGYVLTELPPGPVPPRCALVVVAGIRRPFTGTEARALAEHLGRGGRLLVLVDPERDAGGEGFAPTGLGGVLERHGARLRAAIVVDPEQEVGAPLTWGTLAGYARHPITASFVGRRPTVWHEPRWIDPLEVPGAQVTPLVVSSSAGWAETDLRAVRGRATAAPDERDRRGPVAVAVAAEDPGGWRVVVLGSARSFTSAALEGGLGVNDALLTSSVAWLTGRRQLLGIAPKTPEQLRLVLGAADERRLFWACVLGLPALAAAAGAVVAWRRRR